MTYFVDGKQVFYKDELGPSVLTERFSQAIIIDKLRPGKHRLKIEVVFSKESKTKPKTLRGTFLVARPKTKNQHARPR